MRVLVFRHVAFEGLGRIAASFAARGIAFDYVDLYEPGTPAPDPAGYDALILMGGPMSVNDPLFRGLYKESVFHWHGETFDLPADGVLLASSELCRNQAFRVGENIYGLQFHLEITPEMIEDWCRQDENCGSVQELKLPLDAWWNCYQMELLAEVIFGRWCDMLGETKKGVKPSGEGC